MRIVLRGRWLTTSVVQQIAQIAGAGHIEPRDASSWRLVQFAAPLGMAQRARIRAAADAARADANFIAQPRALHSYRLAVMDMDSTLITIECIDEIADMLGIKPEVSATLPAPPSAVRERVGCLYWPVQCRLIANLHPEPPPMRLPRHARHAAPHPPKPRTAPSRRSANALTLPSQDRTAATALRHSWPWQCNE